jgi:diguanylate cyclase (GGDEF)-like protein
LTTSETPLEDRPTTTPPGERDLERHTWVARGLGLVLLLAALAVIAAMSGPGSPTFIVNAAALIAFAVYVFVAEARTRRLAVNLEKRLRLGLLVHNLELENMAMQDDLTQLFNRRYLFDRLERELDSARALNRSLCVIAVDLDSMKSVNDRYGHRAGDELLKAFGRFLLDYTRASDVPARIGGDEFAIILPDTPIKAANTLKGRLIARLDKAKLIEPDGQPLKVRASFGVACFPEHASSVDELIQQADADMYSEKVSHKAETVGATASGNGARHDA